MVGTGGMVGGGGMVGAGGAGDENTGGVAPVEADPPRLCILPLGDSITQSNADHLSYRYWLWEDLVDAGYEFDFVGSLNGHFSGTPNYPNPDFDRDHEGHWGWRADEIIAQLPGWLNAYTPDVVLMHLGTNDAFQNNPTDSTMDELSQIVGQLRSSNPNVVVLMAKLIPSTMNQAQLDQINANIDGLASELSTDASPVVVVDQASGFNAGPDTFDGIHPNEGGEQKMATKWLDALADNWPTSGGACDM